MAQFTKGRFQMRLYAFCWTILETRQPDFNADKVKKQSLVLTIIQALNYATEAEKQVIRQLSDAIKSKPDIEDERDSMLGALEGKQVIYHKLDPYLLLENKDVQSSSKNKNEYISSMEKPTKSKYILLGCIAAIIIAIIVYNLPICQEYRDYKKVENTTSVYEYIEACDTYLEKYHTKGRHSGDVMYLKVQRTKYDVPVMADYLRSYPDHKHHEEVKQKYNARWDGEIAKYESRDSTKEDKEAVTYMTAMLKYMRDHYCNDVLVGVDLQTNLKEYTEYDEKVRLLLELLNSDPMKIEDGMVSIKDNFSTRNRNELKGILVEGLQKSFNRIFTPYFIRVTTEKSDNFITTPIVRFKCTINTQEDSSGDVIIPHVWVYEEGVTKKVLGYLMGISIYFNADFTIPESTITYTYAEQGSPEQDIQNIENITDGYLHMSAMCFAQFANKMVRNLGLKEIYFQGESS
ncbi:MAG: hypothetical protein IKO26_06650 [Paludibacteraceae bacterium]|nr:hypothetical protein [Paludibacteraceae bacterium]